MRRRAKRARTRDGDMVRGVFLYPEEMERLDALAEAADRSRAEFVLRLIQEALGDRPAQGMPSSPPPPPPPQIDRQVAAKIEQTISEVEESLGRLREMRQKMS